jgi:hypothetical protein
MKPWRVFIVIGTLAGLTAVLHAQAADPLFLETLWPARQRLSGIGAGDSGFNAGAAPDPHQYKLEAELFDHFAVSHNFLREAIQHDNLPLSIAFRETTTSGLQWDMTARTSLSFTTTNTDTMDLAASTLSSTQVSKMGFLQGFGGGQSTTTFGFTRQVTSNQSGTGSENRTTVQEYVLASGLAEGWDLNLKLRDTEINKPGGHWNRDIASALALPMSGGTGQLAFAATHTLADSKEVRSEKVDIVLPFAVSGGQALVERHSAWKNTGILEGTEQLHLASPLKLMGVASSLEYASEARFKGDDLVETQATVLQMGDRGSLRFAKDAEMKSGTLTQKEVTELKVAHRATFDRTTETRLQGDNLAEKKTTVLDMPLKIDGRIVGHKETLISDTAGGVTTDTLQTDLALPISGGTARLQRRVATRPATDGSLWAQRQLAITSPRFSLGDIGHLNVSRTTTETTGQPIPLKVTNVGVGLKPLDILDVDARWRLTDRGTGASLKSRQVHAALGITEGLALKYDFTEDQVRDQSPNLERYLRLERAPKKASDLSISGGYVSWGAEGETAEPAALVMMGVGDEKNLRLDLKYSEYDDKKKLTPYEEDPYVEVKLRRAIDKDRVIELRYQDHEGRVGAERGVRVGMGAFGGNLQLSYAQNALGLDNKTIREADVYDAVLDRRLFGELDLKVGFRYCDYSISDLVEQHYDIRLSGGREDKSGNLMLSYITGELVPNPQRSAMLPSSVLSLSYSRLFGDQGRLRLTVNRETAPDGRPGDEGSITGQLRYDLGF